MMQLDPSTSSISTPTNPIPSGQALQVEVITYMDSDLLKAAQDGAMELFEKCQGGIHCLVDVSQNTALHIYSRTGGRQVVKTDKRFLCFPKKIFEREFSINFVEQLVDKCPSLLLKPNAKGEIPLHIAARHGHSDIVKFLIERAKLVQQEDLEKGLKQMLRMTDKERNTAMHKAVESGDLEVVRLLLKELDPDFSFSANTSGETPLYIAAKARKNDLVSEILDKSMDYGGPDGRTALHAAVMAWDKKSTGKLIEANKQLTKETDNNGWTPLHHAAYYGYSALAKLLLESDASAAYIADKERRMTPLHLAAWGGRKDIMKDIISHCPDCCEIADKRGWNFLHFTVISLDPIKLKRFLFDYKNKINGFPIKNLVDKKDVNGNTPLDILIYRDISVGGGGRSFSQVFTFLRPYSSESYRYVWSGCKTKEKQIQKLLKDIANDEEVLGLLNESFRGTVKKVEENEAINQHEIKEKAREAHLVVATLVATVTFTAAFTVPGGYTSDKQAGTATLIRDSAFKTFVITNTLAFVASLLAIFFHFISVMFRGLLQKYFTPSLIRRADQLTVFAMATMVVAFSTGTYAVLHSSLGFAITALFFGLIFFPSTAALFMVDFICSVITELM